MRGPLAILALSACLLGPLQAFGGTPSATDETAIHSAIASQIDAFRRDDGPGAFSFAAPNIQGMFGTAGNFLDMVRRGYPSVYRPRSVDFTTLADGDGGIVQRVELIGPDGLAYTALYSMEREADGTWRISGCQLVESHRMGV